VLHEPVDRLEAHPNDPAVAQLTTRSNRPPGGLGTLHDRRSSRSEVAVPWAKVS
jgi:hypothetical protein